MLQGFQTAKEPGRCGVRRCSCMRSSSSIDHSRDRTSYIFESFFFVSLSLVHVHGAGPPDNSKGELTRVRWRSADLINAHQERQKRPAWASQVSLTTLSTPCAYRHSQITRFTRGQITRQRVARDMVLRRLDELASYSRP